jgi:hypothetical protein
MCAECKKGDFIPDKPIPTNYDISIDRFGRQLGNDDENGLTINSWQAF